MNSFRNKIFYLFKPFIPRKFQIFLRRNIVLQKRLKYADIWPIDEKAKTPPDEWPGWPGQKQFALILTHDIETANGHGKCQKLMEIEQSLGFKSSFNFVAERYKVSPRLRNHLTNSGFEVGVHGLYHDGKYYDSRNIFQERAVKINQYLKQWKAAGFRSPSMHYNLEWIHDLNIEYDASTFDTDPFEPYAKGVGTIFPFWVAKDSSREGYVELPYTLPQDFTLFVIMQEKKIDIWKKKLAWIVEKGGMALLITHPDYMNFFDGGKIGIDEYPAQYYREFLEHIKTKYEGRYWCVLPRDMARYWVKIQDKQKNENIV